MLFLLGLLAGPALAAVKVYKSKLICDEIEDASGKASISGKGALRVHANGLDPDTEYEVEITCGCAEDEFGEVSEPFETLVTSDENGKLSVYEKHALDGVHCDCPSVIIEDSELDEDGVVCTSAVEFPSIE